MKKIFSFVLAFVFVFLSFGSLDAEAATRVSGYYRSNGTYVSSHYKSSPDGIKSNNYSSKGNYNPYTGKKGYKSW